jgi:hypothetical protein
VYALDEKSAEAAAVAKFKIGDEQRRLLIVRPDDWAGLEIMDTRRIALLALVGVAVITASFFLSLTMLQLLD